MQPYLQNDLVSKIQGIKLKEKISFFLKNFLNHSNYFDKTL